MTWKTPSSAARLTASGASGLPQQRAVRKRPLLALIECRLWFRQDVSGPRNPHVQRRQEEDAHHEISNEPADDHDRKRTLRVRSDAVRERGRQQTERRDEH